MNGKVFKFVILLVSMLVAAGCLPFLRESEEGGICWGRGCRGRSEPSGPAKDDYQLIASVQYYTTFDRSVKPSIDSFFSRYTSAPDDPEINRWINDFFRPAKQLLGQEFDFDPTVKVTVAARESSIYATVAQAEWREVTRADASFNRFLPLVRGDNEDTFAMVGASGEVLGNLDVEAIRWRSRVSAKITAISATRLRYSTTLELDIVSVLSDGKGNKIRMPVAMGHQGFTSLASRLFKSLYVEYMDLFEREYGLVIVQRS